MAGKTGHRGPWVSFDEPLDLSGGLVLDWYLGLLGITVANKQKERTTPGTQVALTVQAGKGGRLN